MDFCKAIIPAAGLGTRFLPATKAVPKEMLPLLEKPAIQYIIEEGVRSEINNFIVVTGSRKASIEDHFDLDLELENHLQMHDKAHFTAALSKILETADFTYVRQKEPLGLGNAIWSARHAVGKEKVAIFLPDEIITGTVPGMSQLIKIAQQEKCSVIAVQEVPMSEVSKYGVVAIKKQFSPNLFQVKSVVEKPNETDAPSNLIIVGRYVLSNNIFDSLKEVTPDSRGEYQLTDGIQHMIAHGEKVFAYKIQGDRYDVGTPLGWIKANIALALKHPHYSQDLSEYLQSLERNMLIMQGQAEQLGKRSKELFF